MHEFLRNIIPVSIDIWILFFLLPGALSFVWQLWLCLKSESFYKKFIPLVLPFVIGIFILLYRFIFIPLGIYTLGFIAVFLIGTALFIEGGAIAGWIVYGFYSLIRKDSKNG
ncbi:MAG: hypothetical protein E7235_02890 [Lachnospiraceae bacterium]|nr:hypothetical protein [Lachnospiraceae bacterium]